MLFYCFLSLIIFHDTALASSLIQRRIIKDDNNQKNGKLYGMINGKMTTINNYPYQAAFFNDNKLIGTAVIINEIWALTTARNVLSQTKHILNSGNLTSYNIRVGNNEPSAGDVYKINTYITHPNFTGYSNDDIALLYLERKIQTGRKVKIIKIADNLPKQLSDITVSGWGGKDSLSIQYLKLPLFYYNNCKMHYIKDEHFTSRSFCTAILNYGPCKVDRGGPAVYRSKLCGIFSEAKVCGSIAYPAIYTDVIQYKSWINSIIESLSEAKKKYMEH
ncbi:trypsin-like [Lycorma delicatula]|uniref:trypsin-like n=1 Tax=Lycorma delicatula TaxID=130591 RepID=UPI003F50DD23